MKNILLLAKYVRENLGYHNLLPLIKISSSKFTHQILLGTSFSSHLHVTKWPPLLNGSSKVPLLRESFYFSTVSLLCPRSELVVLHTINLNPTQVTCNLTYEINSVCISLTLKYRKHCEHWLMTEEVLIYKQLCQPSQGSRRVQ